MRGLVGLVTPFLPRTDHAASSAYLEVLLLGDALVWHLLERCCPVAEPRDQNLSCRHAEGAASNGQKACWVDWLHGDPLPPPKKIEHTGTHQGRWGSGVGGGLRLWGSQPTAATRNGGRGGSVHSLKKGPVWEEGDAFELVLEVLQGLGQVGPLGLGVEGHGGRYLNRKGGKIAREPSQNNENGNESRERGVNPALPLLPTEKGGLGPSVTETSLSANI